MPLIYFIRHGETDWNAEHRIQGHIDTSINPRGRAQALRNALLLAEIISDKAAFQFISSPLLRARQTMEIILEAMGLPADSYKTDERLTEIYFGAWGGLTMDEVMKAYPENYALRMADIWNVAPLDGESFRDFYGRVMEWLAEVKQDTLVVAHGGISRCLIGHCRNLPPEEMAWLSVPQDKVLMIDGRAVSWL